MPNDDNHVKHYDLLWGRRRRSGSAYHLELAVSIFHDFLLVRYKRQLQAADDQVDDVMLYEVSHDLHRAAALRTGRLD